MVSEAVSTFGPCQILRSKRVSQPEWPLGSNRRCSCSRMVIEVLPRNRDDGENGGSRMPQWRNSMPKVTIIKWLVWIAPYQTKRKTSSRAFHTRIVVTRTISARCLICWRSTTLEQRMRYRNPTSSSRDHRKTGGLWPTTLRLLGLKPAGATSMPWKTVLFGTRLFAASVTGAYSGHSWRILSWLWRNVSKSVRPRNKQRNTRPKLLQILTDRRWKASSRMCSLLGKQHRTNDSHTLGIDSIFTMSQAALGQWVRQRAAAGFAVSFTRTVHNGVQRRGSCALAVEDQITLPLFSVSGKSLNVTESSQYIGQLMIKAKHKYLMSTRKYYQWASLLRHEKGFLWMWKQEESSCLCR